MVNDLKNWCLSKIQSLETRLAGDRVGTTLRRSSSLSDTRSDQDHHFYTPVSDAVGGGALSSQSNRSDEKEGGGTAATTSCADDGSAGYYVIEVDVSSGMTRLIG